MYGICMSLVILTIFSALYPQYGAIMVNCHCTDYQLVKAVIIHISGCHIVVTLACPFRTVLCIKIPLKLQPAIS